jgi:flagellar protein FliO/FliZ
VPAHRALTAAFAAASLYALTAPAWVFAADASGDARVGDSYGEDTPLTLPSGGATKADTIGGGGGSLVRTFVGLAIVVAVIYGLTWVLRQMKASKEDRVSGFGLSSEASLPIGPNRSVHLIRAGRELVLVGSAEHGVVPIRTYTEDEARTLGLLEPDGDEDGGAGTGGSRSDRAPASGMHRMVQRLRERTVR